MDINNLFDVRGKVVLVTGGAKGIGRMISEGYVTNGAKVYVSSRDAKACEAAVKELNALGAKSGKGGSADFIPADLQSYDECKRLATELEKRESKLHVLVNNSGAAWGAPYDDFPDEGWTKILNLNLQRVFTLTQLLTPLLEKAANGKEDPARVIHIGSADAMRVPAGNNFSYSAAKAGLHHLGKALAVHLGPRGISSNTLACGAFDTKMMAYSMKHFKEVIEDTTPLGRTGTPADAAGACLFLSSRAGSWVNGAILSLDGGLHLNSKL